MTITRPFSSFPVFDRRRHELSRPEDDDIHGFRSDCISHGPLVSTPLETPQLIANAAFADLLTCLDLFFESCSGLLIIVDH